MEDLGAARVQGARRAVVAGRIRELTEHPVQEAGPPRREATRPLEDLARVAQAREHVPHPTCSIQQFAYP